MPVIDDTDLKQLRDDLARAETDADKYCAEIARLRKIEAAARALEFSAYPAHGSGFVLAVSGGNVDDLRKALEQ